MQSNQEADKKSVRLTISMLLKFLELITDQQFDAVMNNHKVSDVQIREGYNSSAALLLKP